MAHCLGILGLGRMGMAMAENMIKRGYSVYGYSRSKKETKGNFELIVTSDPQTVIENSSEIVIALSDDRAIYEVLFEGGRVRYSFQNRAAIIDTATHNPEFAVFLHREFLKLGVTYLDAPVSGGPERARNGTLSIMVGGKRREYDRCKTVLELLGQDIFYMGKAGSGQATKLVNQILVGISQLATCEAIVFGKIYGIDLALLRRVIESSAGNSEIFQRSAPQMIENKFSHDFQTYLISKDLKNVLKTIEKNNMSLVLCSLASKIFEIHSETPFRNVDAASIISKYRYIVKNLVS